MTSAPSREREIGLREGKAERPPDGSAAASGRKVEPPPDGSAAASGRKVEPPPDGSPAGTWKAGLPARENHLNAKR